MKKFAAFLFIFLFAFLPFGVFAEEGEEPSYVVNKNKNPMTITLWGADEYTYAFELTKEFQELTSDFIQGEEVYDEGSEEYYDTSVAGRKCFSLTAQKAGFYAVIYDNDDSVVEKCEIRKADEDKTEGLFKEKIEILDESNLVCGTVFKMKESEKQYVFIDETNEGSYSLKYAYLGNKIVSAQTAGPLVYDYDTYLAEGYEGDESFPVIEMYPNVNLEFSSGERVKISSFVQTKDLRTSGTIDAEIPVFDEKFPIKVSYIKAEDFAISLSLPDGFSPSCVISYDGIISDYTYPEYVMMKTADGEELKAKRNDSFVLSNGRSYDLWTEYSTEEEGVLTNTVQFYYTLNGISENEIEVTPHCKSIKDTCKDVLRNTKRDMKLGAKILKGEAEDRTTRDGIFNIVSFPHQIVRAIRYYNLFGRYLDGTAILLASVSPLILLTAVVILIVKIKKAKKK